MIISDDQLPLVFDHTIYVNHPGNSDLCSFDEEKALYHYRRFGSNEGRVCSKISKRKDFLTLVPKEHEILEIGPFYSPAFRRPEADVYYLDCLSTEEMIHRAQKVKGATAETIPKIDYLWSGQRYAELIDMQFPSIFSAHNAEHQPCLITHLQDLESVLNERGAVFFVIPDKRYCFDHFFQETTLPDVIEAWQSRRTRHRLQDILDHHFFSTHNEPVRHWRGDHGVNRQSVPLEPQQHAPFLGELKKYANSDAYTDVHAWKFTPMSFAVLLENLYRLKLTRLRVVRLYPTVKNSNEFYAVLMPDRQG